MSFTDDDLKEFKKHIDEFSQCAELQEMFPKLLARLEAAEMFINHWTIENRDRWRTLSGKDKQPGWEAIYTKRKRKAAGKSSATPPVGPEVL